MPDGVIYKPCGNRRATVCPGCAETYHRDAYQLLRAGLIGGKGITPDRRHPPGRVRHLHRPVLRHRPHPAGPPAHLRRQDPLPLPAAALPRPPQPRHLPARPPRRLLHPAPPRRPQARPAAVPGLLRPRPPGRLEPARRRTVAAHQTSHRTPPRPARRRRGSPRPVLRPEAARSPVRVSHGKAAEFQARGAVHFHALLRLDGVDPADPDRDRSRHRPASPSPTSTTPSGRPPPPSATPPRRIPPSPAAGRSPGAPDRHPTHHPAGTGTSPTGWSPATSPSTPPKPPKPPATPPPASPPTPSTCTPTRTAPTPTASSTPAGASAPHPGYVSLRRWAHMLGFGGHFLTKARRYSVRFRDLRQARITYRRRQDTGPEHGPIRTADHTDDETILIIGTSPTPEPAGTPPATPCSPTPPPTRPANATKPDATSSPTNTPRPWPARPRETVSQS